MAEGRARATATATGEDKGVHNLVGMNQHRPRLDPRRRELEPQHGVCVKGKAGGMTRMESSDEHNSDAARCDANEFMADHLDSLVKGAPAPGKDAKAVTGTSGVSALADPLINAPSSPPMVYLNLLVLEASLRAQFLELRARRRHHTFFLALLTLWIGAFGYGLFLAPREDGSGVGGSVYWGIETFEKLCFMGGIMTAILVWVTGIWDRGIRWPRRWFAVSNRGLRAFNCKLVLIRRSWWAELASTIGFFLTYGLFSHTASSSYRHVDPPIQRDVEKELGLAPGAHPPIPIVTTEDEEKGGGTTTTGSGHGHGHGHGHEEDLASGGDYVKLLLLAKPFTPAFRENWELYRAEYWERENERRALLRKKLKERDRRLAKERWGIFWWLPWRRVPGVPTTPSTRSSSSAAGVGVGAGAGAATHSRNRDRDHDTDKLHPRAAALEKQYRRRNSNSNGNGNGNGNGNSNSNGNSSTTRRRSSTSSSPRPRNITPTVESDDPAAAAAAAVGLSRKASSGSSSTGPTTSEKEKKPRRGSKLSVSSSTKPKRPRADSRSVTPEKPSPLSRESSAVDGAGSGMERTESRRPGSRGSASKLSIASEPQA
ncbi:hypothetical protein SODALDRAFT_322020 [Sodiomyces alkalinus F11]|uniref:Spo7-domain-containing protein n=1 Tax=Sodiomyces alkalinus (strain CBS 110278 / VKM F-3762 / F11) TaxID=1314773 RepID=A0A3N2Q1V4_SODAK|nr:hypothetical protein SODALDRAFT_322020 [Sodiomyces alkalinus F11]ROT40727.1 hypothetical protein SODALDRAFT_322020 [Sodiomyces alkalinus F11]